MTRGSGGILIIGKTGQVARSLSEELAASDRLVTTVGRPEIDLCAPRAVADAIVALRPGIVVNAAAYTAVERAEEEPETAFAVNAAGAEAVARGAAEVGAPVIHISTDYVFDGSKRAPYIETDLPNPTCIYGKSKLLGEQRVAAANPRHVILRTAWVFSPFANNFVKTVLRLGQAKSEIRVVNDQRGNPTYAPDLAAAIRRVIEQLHDASADTRLFGTFHAVNSGTATWFEFAQAIMDGGARRGNPRADVCPIATKDYPAKAQRPAHSMLSTVKLADIYGIRFRPWYDALSDGLDRLTGPSSQGPRAVSSEPSNGGHE